MRYGKSSGWCKAHALSFRAMSRVVSIRAQLKKYMQRFNLPLDSCEGDAKRLRVCLVSGYWRNGARWMADGTYRSVRGNKVKFPHRSIMYSLMMCHRDSQCSPNFSALYTEATIRVGCIPRDGGNEKDTVSVTDVFRRFNDLANRIRILTEIEPDW